MGKGKDPKKSVRQAVYTNKQGMTETLRTRDAILFLLQ
jgi:hypothetical protein